eukprot:NODE_4069_length_845_cov_18.664573_g3370_i0.p1 GENE.NODE_4069_length_845_cov_18.664573_g3370_i0~~NODE_4069_length_845_cov_18.664573_g3370_i0.p1  ORF type:complete len:260 (+),score=62.56 NODE_4069_length_845_cov_18.664573_g3370_i0:110-781(+)
MINTIREDVKDQISTIKGESASTFQAEKASVLAQEKEVVLRDFDRAKARLETDRRVHHSRKVADTKHIVLKEREKMLKELSRVVDERLRALTNDQAAYKPLLEKTVLEGISQLKIEKVVLQCTEKDKALLESMLPSLSQRGGEMIGKSVRLQIDPKSISEDKCIGGVLLRSAARSMFCNNTLVSRRQQIVRERLPDIRALLFGELSPELRHALRAECGEGYTF